ncbi:unnamed protein product [Auanema sp. JU1783]|nr:unnamed protein product [Auanema sp. JU1783]
MDSIVMNSVSVDVNIATVFGANASGKKTNEYEAYHIVDTSTSFTILNAHEQKSFFPHDGNDLHALMTIMTENDDGSWSMHAENHSIIKRCIVTFDGRNIYATPGHIEQVIPHLTGADASLQLVYKLGLVEIINKSLKDIFVRVDSDNIRNTKVRTEVSAKLSAEYKKIKGSAGVNGVSEVTNTVYYRADQSIGYTYLPAAYSDYSTAEFYLNVPSSDQYFVSIAYMSYNDSVEEVLVQLCENEAHYHRRAEGIPRITIYENHKSGGILAVPCKPGEHKDRNMGLY